MTPRPRSSLIFAVTLVGLVGLIGCASSFLLFDRGLFGPPVGEPVIPPGREPAILEFLRPLAEKGFAGREMSRVQVEGGALQVQLASTRAGSADCSLPPSVSPPGRLTIASRPRARGSAVEGDGSRGLAREAGLEVRWRLCAESDREARAVPEAAGRLVRELSRRHPERVWGEATSGGPGRSDVGLMTPLVAATGLSAGQVVAWAWALALLLSVVALALLRRPTAADPPDHQEAGSARPRWWVLALVVALAAAGLGARLWSASTVALDGDEVWATPLANPVFDDDHDAWVHPPLHRALQQLYVSVGRWQESWPTWALRLPSLLSSALCLALLLVFVGARPWRQAFLLPVAVAALGPGLIEASVLARPYALAALLVAIAAASAWAPARPGPRRLRWLVAVTAAGLAAWTDLVAGLAAMTVVATALAAQPGLGRAARAGLIVALLAWGLPLVPGGLRSIREQVHPEATSATQVGVPDLRPSTATVRGAERRAVSTGQVFGFGLLGTASAQVALQGLGVGLLLVLLLLAFWRHRPVGAALSLVFVEVFFLSELVTLRPRNLLFLPALTGLAAVVVLPELRRRGQGAEHRRVREASPPE